MGTRQGALKKASVPQSKAPVFLPEVPVPEPEALGPLPAAPVGHQTAGVPLPIPGVLQAESPGAQAAQPLNQPRKSLGLFREPLRSSMVSPVPLARSRE